MISLLLLRCIKELWHHRSSVHALYCNSDCSDDESNDIYAAEFVWSSQAKPFTCSALKPIHKNWCRGVQTHSRVAECTRLSPEGEYSGVS